MSDITRICEALDEHYGAKKWDRPEPVLDELILTILSQNTTAANCKLAFARLRERFPAWEDVMNAWWEKVAEAIRVGGLANRKAPRIIGILRQIYGRQGNLDLEWLRDVSDSEAIDYLMAFDGVGRKTAACVLVFAMGRPVLPVDTHVHRVAMRLGIIGKMSAEQAHDALAELVPPERVYSFHVNMVAHGREICHAQRPKCEICPLRGECDYFARQARISR